MTQNKNTPNNQQSGNQSNQQIKDGASKETNPNNPTANKSNQQRPGSANQQSSFDNQERQNSPSNQSNQGKTDKNYQDTDGRLRETEDKEIATDKETSGKRKLNVSEWSEIKPENKNVKK